MTTTITIDPQKRTVAFGETDLLPEHPGLHEHPDRTITVDGLPAIDWLHRDRIRDHLAPLMADLASGDNTEALFLIHRAAYEPAAPSLSRAEREAAAHDMHEFVDAWEKGDTDADSLIAAISTAAGVVSHGVREREDHSSIAQGRAPYAYCGVFLGGASGGRVQCPVCEEIADQDARNAAVFDELEEGDR